MRFPGFIGPSYTLQSVNVDCQSCINLFPEINALGTGKEREVAALVPTPGLRLLATLPTSPFRGILRTSKGTLFAVGGNKLYQITSAWVATERGSLNTSTGPISMSDNGLDVFIVDGSNGYTLTMLTNTFAVVVSPDFQIADQVTFQDGYFLFNKKNSNSFFISGLNASTFNASEISSAEGSPDDLIGLISVNLNVYLFGSQTIEVFFNSGNADFPFERIQGAVISVGCAAAFSIAKLQESIFFLGGDESGSGIVYRIQGYRAEKISTPAIETLIRSIDPELLTQATAWTYQQGGHSFYCLNLPTAKSTWVYDTSTSMWHERTYLGSFGQERHRSLAHASIFGENVVGDYENGNIYALDQMTYNDNGRAIVRKRASPHFTKGLLNVFHSRFQLDMETGVGLDGSGQGSAPLAMIRWSDDGGHTWSDYRTTSIGGIGERGVRAIWRRLGRARDRVYEVSISEPVKVVLIGADVDFEVAAA